MKKLRYTTGMKISFVLFQQIFAALIIIMIVLLSTLFQRKMFDTSNLLNNKFANSGYYNVVFEKTVTELLEYVSLKETFEKNGTYNEDKSINVLAYANGELFYHDKDKNIQGNDVQDEMTYELKDLLSWSEEGYKMGDDGIIEETYLPGSGISLHDAVKNAQLQSYEAQRISRALYDTLRSIQGDVTTYKKCLNKYDVNPSNVKYWIGIDSMQKVYTNMKSQEKQTIFAGIDNQQGSYFYYDNSTFHLKTSVSSMSDYFYNYMDTSTKDIGNMPSMMVSVDTKFLQKDDFTQAKSDYEKYHPWLLIGTVILAISAFGWIFTLIYLTMAAGKNENRKNTEQENKVLLNWLDRIWTEFLFLGFLTFVSITTLITVQVFYASWQIPGMLVMAGTMAYVGDSAFLVLYLSMIRRIKAETLWKESFCHKFLIGMQRVFRHWKISVRLMATYALEVMAFLCITYFVFLKNSGIALLFLILLIGIKISYIIKKEIQRNRVLEGIKKISDGNITYKINTEGFFGSNKDLADSVNRVGEGLYRAVDENTKSERMKADLVTNVSHDIKTPLTSIINYVNLIKMESIENDKIKNYVDILDIKAERLKQLTEDLVEASKISSGNIELDMQCINFVELVYQTGGEFNEKFENKDLTIITKLPNEPVMIMADGKRIWRVIENLYNNAAKYALAHTRVYVSMETQETNVVFSIKNISEQQIKVETEELTERFIRGDTARTTEGSGLGLSIAKNLTELMNGTFLLDLDGDLFKVDIIFPLVQKEEVCEQNEFIKEDEFVKEDESN